MPGVANVEGGGRCGVEVGVLAGVVLVGVDAFGLDWMLVEDADCATALDDGLAVVVRALLAELERTSAVVDILKVVS